jgi:hypothetical protein
MEFRLTYEGELMHKCSQLADHKQDIRKHFHRQLRRLWEIHPFLRDYRVFGSSGGVGSQGGMLEQIAAYYSKGPYRFVPLAREDSATMVSLEILFLRSGEPGKIIRSADIDGRLKTLLDALRMPAVREEWGSHKPEDGEDPFFCLMEDDKLVASVSVTTDTLLAPIATAKGAYDDTHDCRIVISVKLKEYGEGHLPFYSPFDPGRKHRKAAAADAKNKGPK